MKREKSGILLLLGALLLFSASVGFLYGDKTDTKTVETQRNPAEIVAEIAPLVITRSVEKIVEALQPYPVEIEQDVIRQISHKDSELSARDSIHIIFGVAAQQKNPAIRARILDMLLTQNQEKSPSLFLYAAATSSYSKIISDLLAWMDHNRAAHPELAQDSWRSYMHAAHKGDAQTIALLHAAQVPLTKTQINDLAWLIISQPNAHILLPELMRMGADLNAPRNGYTLLIKAVESKNIDAVKLLVEQGNVDMQAMVDPAVGTALDRSIGTTPIELYLRAHGAR